MENTNGDEASVLVLNQIKLRSMGNLAADVEFDCQ